MTILRSCCAQYASRSGTRAIVPSSFMISQITPEGLRPASRARSTAASVWPVRSSTPPGLALSGKMCPGWTRSRGSRRRVDRHLDRARAVVRGDAGGHALARLDRHRERGLERRLVLGGHQVEAELVAALGRERQADQPAPLLRHEVDRLGRGELGGHREVALVLAVLGVADHDHLAVARMSSSASSIVLNGALLIAVTSFSTYFANTSTSRFTTRPGAASAERRALERLRDQRNGEAAVVHGRHCKRHAVDRDRALLDDVAQQVSRAGADPDEAREALVAARLDRADAVDVALDHVAAEPVARAQRQLDVHRVALAERPERGAAQGLGHHVGARSGRRRARRR